MKHFSLLGIVLAFCSGAAHAGAAPCFAGRDIDHVTLRGEIVQSAFPEGEDYSARPAGTKYTALVLDDPICFSEDDVPGTYERFSMVEADPVSLKKWLGHHVVVVGNLSVEGPTIVVTHIKDAPFADASAPPAPVSADGDSCMPHAPEGQAPQWAVDLEKRHGDHLSATDPVWQHATCDERHHTVRARPPPESRVQKKKLKLPPDLARHQHSVIAPREIISQHRRRERTKGRSSKYLNNLSEEDRRSIKRRLGPMLGLKRFRCASITIGGIQLTHRIWKGQFKLGKLRIEDNTAPEIWNAVLAARAA